MNEANPVRGMRPHTNPNTNARAWRIQWMTSCSSPWFLESRSASNRRLSHVFSRRLLLFALDRPTHQRPVVFFVYQFLREAFGAFRLRHVVVSPPLCLSFRSDRSFCIFPWLRLFRSSPLPSSCLSGNERRWMDPTRWIEPNIPIETLRIDDPIGPNRPYERDPMPFLSPRRTQTIVDRRSSRWTDGLCGLSMGDIDPMISAVGQARPRRVWCTNTRHTCFERHGRCIDRDEWTGCTRAGRRNGRNARDPTEDGCVTHENADRPRRVGSEKHHITMERKRKTNTYHTMDNSHVDAQAKRSRRITS